MPISRVVITMQPAISDAPQTRAAAPATGSSPTFVERDGRTMLVFGGCNYLGLAHHPSVLDAARQALSRFGVSASASRQTTGNTSEHEALEDDLAAYFSPPGHRLEPLLTPDGYTANLAALQALAHHPDRPHLVAIVDERAHPSLRDAALAAGLPVRTFSHFDIRDLRLLLDAERRPAAVLTDGVFSADGALAPLRAMLAALRPEDTLLIDDCHGFGTIGEGGRGSTWHAVIHDHRVVITATLAKGIGCGGGVVLAPADVTDAARRLATAYVCTTPVAPAVAAAARRAIGLLWEEPDRVERLHDNARRLRRAISEAGHRIVEAPTPIAAFVVDDPAARAALARTLDAACIALPLIDYPGGPAETYFRASVTAEHTAEQIELLASVLRGV